MKTISKRFYSNVFPLLLALGFIWSCGELEDGCPPASSINFQSGELEAAFRGNSGCSTPTDNLSGISLLVNNGKPDVKPFQSVGLNFEHIISGHADPRNLFEPRFGNFTPTKKGEDSVTLTRKVEDSLWGMATELTFKVVPPYYIDFEFSATPSRVDEFQPHNFVAFFFASYMSEVETSEGYYFRGIPGPGQTEQWVNSSSTPDHSGATFISHDASALVHDSDPMLDLNLDNKQWPRITEPYYCGQVAGGMVYQIMFDRLNDPIAGEEVRFTNFKWNPLSPAWDFEYVVYNPQVGVPHQLRGRVVWKPFVDLENCEAEYLYWVQQESGTF